MRKCGLGISCRAIAIAALLIMVLRADAAQVVPAGNIAAQWPFDALSTPTTTDDISGNSNTATLVGTPTLAPALFGNGLQFNGSNQSLTVADSASLAVGTGDFTVAAWINPTNVATKVRIMNKLDTSGVVGIRLDINASVGGGNTPSNLRLQINDGTHSVDYVAPAGLVAGSWAHIAATVNRTAHQLMLFANGVQIGTTQDTSLVTGTLTNTNVMEIGALTGGNYFGGIMDEPILYTRALSPAEIMTLAAIPSNLTASTTLVNKVTLNWTAVPGASSYNILRSGTTGGPAADPYVKIGSVNAPATTYTDLGALNPGPYFYVVQAVLAGGGGYTSQNSNEAQGASLPPEITIAPTSLLVLEGGGPVAFTLTLVAALNTGESITIPVNGNPAVLISPLSGGNIVITGPQPAGTQVAISVTGVDDFIANDPQSFQITFGTSTSANANYNGIDYLPPINVTTVEGDTAGVFVVPSVTPLATVDGGPPVTFTVQLSSKPVNPVTITFSVSNPSEATVSGPLQFTSLDWNMAKQVTVTPLAEDQASSDFDFVTSYSITMTFTGDASYAGMAVPPVVIAHQDNEQIPKQKKVWGCGLLGSEACLLVGVLALLRRRRRR